MLLARITLVKISLKYDQYFERYERFKIGKAAILLLKIDKNDGFLNVYIYKNIDRIDCHVLSLKVTSFLSYHFILIFRAKSATLFSHQNVTLPKTRNTKVVKIICSMYRQKFGF